MPAVDGGWHSNGAYRGVAQTDADSRNVRNDSATADEGWATSILGWFGPDEPPAVAGEFDWLRGGWS